MTIGRRTLQRVRYGLLIKHVIAVMQHLQNRIRIFFGTTHLPISFKIKCVCLLQLCILQGYAHCNPGKIRPDLSLFAVSDTVLRFRFGGSRPGNIIGIFNFRIRICRTACHTGTTSCFTNEVFRSEERHEFSLEQLMTMLEGRKTEKKEGSYTTYLFEKGIDKILKKVGEECTEVIIAGKADDKKETIYEIADLAYHVMVLMLQMGITLEDIHDELASRHVIDHKVKQEKMTK